MLLLVKFITAFGYDALMQHWAQSDVDVTEAVNTLCACFGWRTAEALSAVVRGFVLAA